MQAKLKLIAPFLLSSAVLLVPGAAIADPSVDDGSDKNICYTIGPDYYRCLRASRYCWWDREDSRCEPYNDTTYCGRVTSRYQCNAQSGCFWDFEDDRCETIH